LPKSKTMQKRAAVKPKQDFQVKESVIYEENVPIGLPWLVVLLGAIGVLIWALIISAVAPGSKNPIGLAVLAVIILAFLWILWNFRRVTIRITNKEGIFKYGRLSSTVIKRNALYNCVPTKARFGRFLAIGARQGLDGSRGYITSMGKAVEFEVRGQKNFVVSSRHPEDLCEAIDRWWGK
jgi:Protein of unknown function (DUF3093)